MTKRVCLAASLLTAVLLFPAVPAHAASAGSTDGVVSVLLKKYPLTEMTADKTQLTHEGAQLSLKQAGVYSYPAKGLFIHGIDVKDGKVQSSKLLSYSCGSAHCHVLQSGEKVYVTKIEAKPDSSGDALKLSVASVENIDAGDGSERYAAVLTFKFKKGYLSESSPDDVEASIEAVLAPGDDSADSGKSNTAADNQPAAPKPSAPVQRAAPPAQCPAVAAAPAGPLPDLSIGERWSEVLKGYGMPTQIIDLGKKVTFIYKDAKTKVVFTDDKISDMQPL